MGLNAEDIRMATCRCWCFYQQLFFVPRLPGKYFAGYNTRKGEEQVQTPPLLYPLPDPVLFKQLHGLVNIYFSNIQQVFPVGIKGRPNIQQRTSYHFI
jgi:hypothetical protein